MENYKTKKGEEMVFKKPIDESSVEEQTISKREKTLLEIQRQENQFKTYIEELKTNTPPGGRTKEEEIVILNRIEEKINENYEEIRKTLE